MEQQRSSRRSMRASHATSLVALCCLLCQANAYMLPVSSVQRASSIGARRHTSRQCQVNMKAVGTFPRESWQDTKTRELWQAVSAGQLRKRDFTGALATRLASKAQRLATKFSPVNVDRFAQQLADERALGSTTAIATTDTPAAAAAAAATASPAAAAKDIEAGWQAKGYGSALARGVGIWSFAFRILWQEGKLRKEKDLAVKSARRTAIAVQLREGLLDLGPTFIKLGQLLSTRIDVVPQEYISELVQLQDNVPGFSGARALAIVEEELGRPIAEVFSEFNVQPLAAASLGQVHVGTLRDSGRKVAVKVQRQGLKDLFDQDLQNLKTLVKLLDRLDPKLDGADRNWVRIYEESAKLLYQEIDYMQEAANAQRFKENFAETSWVKVPDIEWDLSTERVLVMEYVPGIKINDIAEIERRGIDRKVLAKRSAEAFLTQLCRYSLFHSDPHPGNVACDEAEGGRLIFYDFGMMDELTPMVRTGLVNLIFSVYENDAKACCDALEQMGILKEGSDRVSVERIARSFLSEFSRTITAAPGGSAGADAKWASQLPAEERKRLRAERRAKLGADLLTVSGDVPFQFPPTFTFVFRAFTSLDGIGKGLDPAYDLTRLAQPYLRELLDLRDGSATLSAIKTFGKAVGWRPQDINAVVTSPRSVAYVSDVVQRLEQGDLKLRVRVLESERAFARLELVQSNLLSAVAFGTFLNAALLTSAAADAAGVPLSLAGRACWALAGAFGLKIPIGALKLKREDKKLKTYGLRG
eukprot:TRINITY_DN5331_c1_g1_i3.p1 TRINITY_DN5331_c1_g1~~TRINITY_DN5331_c1_g1_i3.p1  ORF type:complete len:758 (-),score=347.01 TRINITY_DN5331_c1_g1_i3:727-3000(-)